MSLLTSMNIAQQSLLSNQASLNIVSNNIANMNTAGYSRQRVEQSPEVNFTPIGGSVANQIYSGSGVRLDEVTRYTDTYLQAYFRQQSSISSYLEQFSTTATSLEDIVNELEGTGLEATFSKFFEASQNLSLNPSSSTARQNFMQQAQTVALKFNDMATTLQQQRTDLVGDVNVLGSLDASKIASSVLNVNNQLERIAKVNNDIVKISSPNMAPNNLLDIRDQLVDELSKMLPVDISENPNGTINVSMNGVELIIGTSQVGNLNIKMGDTNTPAIIGLETIDGKPILDNINDTITSGTMGAILDAGGSKTDILTVKSTIDGLDTLANGFAALINRIQTGVDASGTPMAIDEATNQLMVSTENIFESKTGGAITAGNIKINSKIMDDPYLIAAARVDIASYDPNAVGNNNNMLKVLDLRTKNAPELNNNNPESYLAALVGNIGLKVEGTNTNVENQKLVLTQIENQLNAVRGVNIDEEIIDLTKYQRAYQASARVFTVCNDLLELLVNLGK